MTDETGELPEGWAIAALGEIADCRLGKMLDQAKNRGKPRPYLRNTNVQWGEIGVEDIKEMRIEEDERERYCVRAGDLIVCEGGEPGRCAVWRNDREMYLQKALHRVRPYDGISPDYLRWWLQEAARSGQLEDLFTGSTIKHLPGRQLARIRVPVAPTQEQLKIAEHLREVDQRLATAIRCLDVADTKLARLRTAVLISACGGTLTADWRRSGAACEVDADLQALRKRATTNPGTRLTRSDPAVGTDLPDGWSAARLGEVATVMLGGTPSRKEPRYWNGHIRWVSSGEVANCRIGATRECITKEGLANSNAKVYPAGTVLVAMIGEGKTRGQSAILDVEAATNQNAAGIVVNADLLNPEYVWRWARAEYESTRAIGRGGNQPALNGQKVRGLVVPVPPLTEQAEIVRRVDAVMAAIDRLTGVVNRVRTQLRATSDAASCIAFRGELVPTEASLAEAEGRPYESAADVLARFAEAQPSKPTRSRRAPNSA